MPWRFQVVGVSGTFDMLHEGHRTLLKKAFGISEYVIIGLCSDEFVKRMQKTHATAPYSERLKVLSFFLNENGLIERAKIVSIRDIYGGVATVDSPVEALVVSEETEPAAVEINEKRKEVGLSPVEVVVIDLVLADNNTPISTTKIRHGEIDQEGHTIGNRKN